MKNKAFLLLFFVAFSSFSQVLEEDIYVATERFLNKPNTESLKILNTEIKTFRPQLKTKDEYFAFINLIVNKAYFLSENNKQNLAISAYENAFQIYKKNNIVSYDIIDYCLIPLGILYHKTNAYIKAENIINYYIALAKKQGNTTQQITGKINLAKLYQSLNKHKSAIAIANEGLKFKDLKSHQKQRLNSIKRRSNLLIASNQKRLFLDNDIVFDDTETLESLNLKYQLAIEAQDYSNAQKNLYKIEQKTLKNKLTPRRSLAKLSFQKAQLYYLLNTPKKALDELEYTLSILAPSKSKNQQLNKTELYPENTFIDILDLFAVLHNNPEQKLHYYDLSFYVSALLDEETTSDESLIIKATANRKRAEKCIGVLHQLYQTEKDLTYLERAINYAEKHKASILKKRFQKQKQLQNYGKNDTLIVKENRLLKEQKQLVNKLLNKPVSQKDYKKQDSLRLQLIDVGIALKSLKKNSDKNSDNKPTTIASIKAKLSEKKTALVVYFYGNNDIYQFVFSENSTEFNKIPIEASHTEQLITFAKSFNDASTINSDISVFTDTAFSIYDFLKLDTVSEAESVVIIPDGLLHFIPFEALLYNKTETASFSKMPFLVKRQSLTYNSSLTLYLNTKKERLKDKVLGVFPVFENTNRALLYTKKEAEGIKNHLETEVLMQQSATKENFIKRSKDFSVLHLSTHASSGDFVNPAKISFYNNDLPLNELYTLELKPNLVVLSACETGVGTLFKGEGVMSIANGFQYAGAENVLFSLWQINDLSTSQIMSSFYKYYGDGHSAGFANTQSKLDYLNNTTVNNAKKSPYYWSAFLYYGDNQELKDTNPLNLLWIFSIVALLIVVFLAFRFYKKNGKLT